MARRVSSGFYGRAKTVHRTLAPFDLTHRVATSMKVGYLYPVDLMEILPGDEFRERTDILARLTSTFVRPIMDDLFLDVYHFFVPLRLLQSDLEDVFGDNSPSAYTSLNLAEIAHWTATNKSNHPQPGSVADYLGAYNAQSISTADLPAGTSVLPFRCLPLIWNNYFRNQNVQAETYVQLGNQPHSLEKLNSSNWSASNYTGMPPRVNRYRDYFSTAVPKPQKGDPIRIPLSGLGTPFLTFDDEQPEVGYNETLQTGDHANSSGAISIGTTNSDNGEVSGVEFSEGGVDVNDLRAGVQMQKYRERDMIYGSRYIDYVKAAYGVTAPGARLQIPEPLGSSHIRLNVSQVVTTGEGTNYDVAQVAGMSQTLNQSGRWSRRFMEHGYVMTVACIRYKHLYSNGLHRLWHRTKREHFYDPLFSHLGYQRIYQPEVWNASGNWDTDNAFGYQEPWMEYRSIPDRVSGQMRPTSGALGQFWSLADAYSSRPTLVDFMYESSSPIERVITSDEDTQDPFIIDFRFSVRANRVVTTESTPGLVDHF